MGIPTEIWAAVISALAAIIVCVITSYTQHKRYVAELDKQIALLVYRISQLEEKVSAHNHYDSRLVALEQQVKSLFSRMSKN